MSLRRDRIQLEVDINGQKAGKTYRELINQGRSLKRELKELVPGTEEFIRKSQELKQVNDKLADIRAETRGVAGAMDQANAQSRLFATVTANAAQVAYEGFQRVIGAIKAQIAESNRLFDIQAKADAQQRAVIESTNRAAGRSLEQLKEQAQALQDVTLFGDEEVQRAQNLLLTFTNIQGDVFDRTTETALDLSVALDQDLKTSAIQLGKALQDPIKGVSALSEVGVSFTEQQREQIKALTESGEVAEAQGLILETLETQVKGSAQAVAEVGRGEWQQFQNILDDVSESIGRIITQNQRGLLNALRNIATGFRELLEPQDRTIENLQEQRRQFNLQIATLKRLEPESEARADFIKTINEDYGDYLDNLLTEQSSLEDLEAAQKRVNEAFLQRIVFVNFQEELEALGDQIVAFENQAVAAEIALAGLPERQRQLGELGASPSQIEGLGQQAEFWEQIGQASGEAAENARQQLPELEERYDRIAQRVGTTLEKLRELFDVTNNEDANPFDQAKEDAEAAAAEIEALNSVIKDLGSVTLDATELEEVFGANDERLESISQDSQEQLQAQLNRINLVKKQRIEALQESLLVEASTAEEREAILREFETRRAEIIRNAEREAIDARLFELEIGSEEYLELQERILALDLEQWKSNQEAKTAVQQEEENRRKATLGDFANVLADFNQFQINNLSETEAEKKKNFKRIQNLEANQVIVNLFSELSNIYKSYSALGVFGQILANVQAALATARAFKARKEIKSQEPGFAGGGYTGDGVYQDATGERVAGVVHAGEWVANRQLVEDPTTAPIIDYLERIRRRRGGFQEGGFTEIPNTTPVGVSVPGSATQEVGSLIDEVRILRSAFEQSQRNLRAYVVYQDVEDSENELNIIQKNASLT